MDIQDIQLVDVPAVLTGHKPRGLYMVDRGETHWAIDTTVTPPIIEICETVEEAACVLLFC